MNQDDVLASITTQFRNDANSMAVKIILNSGRICKGKFIKNNQKEFNIRRNKWIITIGIVELMVDGDDINSFFPFKH